MAINNYKQKKWDENVRKKYKELKIYIRSKDDETQKLNEFWIVGEHLEKMEKTILDQQEQIKEYKQFFCLLNNFLPEKPSKYY